MKIGVGLLVGADAGEYIHKWYENIVEWADFVSVYDNGYSTSKVTHDVIHGGPVKFRYMAQSKYYLADNGFSVAKNGVLLNCYRDADWVIMLDADEMLLPYYGDKIREQLAKVSDDVGIVTITRLNQVEPPKYPDGLLIPMIDWDGQIKHSIFEPEPQHKILRMTKTTGYTLKDRPRNSPYSSGIIHEEPVGAGRAEIDISIYHFNLSLTQGLGFAQSLLQTSIKQLHQ